jgi:hypothetical protein
MRGLNRVWARAALSAAAALACARMAPPPGGPPDFEEPEIIATRPESVAVLPGFRGEVEFVFNEVISEGSAPNFGLGTGTLEQFVILSPSLEVPAVRWRRNRITVSPREGWQPGLVYRVELRPGIMDLSNNRAPSGAVVTFTTGAGLPATVLRGRVVDWTTRRPQPEGVVHAVLHAGSADSLVYRMLADSLGFFEFGPLPEGEYLVFGGIDQNRNRRIEPRELFDSVRVAAGADSVGEIWAFRHDTAGPRLQTVARRDSVSVTLQFTQQLRPVAAYDSALVRVLLLPDSVPVAVAGLYTQEAYDLLFRARRDELLTPEDSARADSLRREQERRDSIRADSLARLERLAAERAAEDARRGIVRRADPRAAPRQLDPLTTRPALTDRLVIRLDTTLIPGARYVVEVRGVENLSRASMTSLLVLVIPDAPPPPPPDTSAVRPDTAAARPGTPPVLDSLRQPPDTGRGPWMTARRRR